MSSITNFIEMLREPKIPFTGGMVVFDWVATLVFAYIVAAKYYNDKSDKTVFALFSFLILISILIHKEMNIPTVTNYYLGLSKYPDRK